MQATSPRPLCVLALAALGIAACRSHYPTATTAVSLGAAKTATSMERGKVMLMTSCAGCHVDFKTGKLSGRRMEHLPGVLGPVYSANLTSSKSHGIMAQYSDVEFAYLLRTGIARDGRYIPYMLRPNMADQDIRDMLIYLRSDDAGIAAVDASPGQTRYSLIGKMARPFMGKPLPYRAEVALPQSQLARGYYLVDNGGCFHCHSKKITGQNYMQPELTNGYLAGGAKFKTPDGSPIRGANITKDSATGIGFYTKAEFREAVRHARGPGGRKLQPPMEAFSHLSEDDADAIYTYIQNLPARHHRVKGQLPPIER